MRLLTLKFGTATAFVITAETESCQYLLGQQVEQSFYIDSDMVSYRTAVDLEFPKYPGKIMARASSIISHNALAEGNGLPSVCW